VFNVFVVILTPSLRRSEAFAPREVVGRKSMLRVQVAPPPRTVLEVQSVDTPGDSGKSMAYVTEENCNAAVPRFETVTVLGLLLLIVPATALSNATAGGSARSFLNTPLVWSGR
jgi:hypothetical protein